MLTDSKQDPTIWANALSNKNNTRDEWEKVYGDYDAAVDWPTCSFYKHLIQRYPESKVILTTRSAESWYASVSQTVLPLVRWRFIRPYLPNHLWQVQQLWRQTFVNNAVTDPEDDSPLFDRENLIRCYNDHIKEVKAVVPADRLLILTFSDGWEPLCRFLDKPIPDIPYPSTNPKAGFSVFFWEPMRQKWGDQLWFQIWETVKVAIDRRPIITPTRTAAAVYIISKLLVHRFNLSFLMKKYITLY